MDPLARLDLEAAEDDQVFALSSLAEWHSPVGIVVTSDRERGDTALQGPVHDRPNTLRRILEGIGTPELRLVLGRVHLESAPVEDRPLRKSGDIRESHEVARAPDRAS